VRRRASNAALVDDFPGRIEHADRMLLVAEIKAEGDRWNFRFHGSDSVARPSSAACHCLLI
jgi:hypothetical protein